MTADSDNHTARLEKYHEVGRAVIYVAVFGAIYAFLMLSTNQRIPAIAFIIFTLLQLARIVMRYRAFSRLGLMFEGVLLATLLAGVIGSYGWDLRAHPFYSSFLFLVLLGSKMKSVLFGIDS